MASSHQMTDNDAKRGLFSYGSIKTYAGRAVKTETERQSAGNKQSRKDSISDQ